MGKTKIEWADETWNPVIGCSKISEGCKNCYAERIHTRRHQAWLDGWKSAPRQYHCSFGVTQFFNRRLEEPLHWRKPRKVFCCSMGDLFYKNVSTAFILKVLNTMEQVNANRIRAGQEPHRFMVLTKRARRMREVLESWFDEFQANKIDPVGVRSIWFGVSLSSSLRIDRVVDLTSIKSPVPIVRFISAEPLLGFIDLRELGLIEKIDWIIAGGETGPNAREMAPMWVRKMRDQAVEYGVPFFFKQWGGKKRGRVLDGRTWDEEPA